MCFQKVRTPSGILAFIFTFSICNITLQKNISASVTYGNSTFTLGAVHLVLDLTRPALGSTHPPIQWVPGALSPGVKRLGREADHSPPSSTEIKNAWCCTSIPQYVFIAWSLVKHRENFTFAFAYAIGFAFPEATHRPLSEGVLHRFESSQFAGRTHFRMSAWKETRNSSSEFCVLQYTLGVLSVRLLAVLTVVSVVYRSLSGRIHG